MNKKYSFTLQNYAASMPFHLPLSICLYTNPLNVMIMIMKVLSPCLSKEINLQSRPFLDDIDGTAAARPTLHNRPLPLLLGQVFARVVLLLPRGPHTRHLVGRHQVHTAPAPAGPREPRPVTARLARNAANLVNLGTTALVVVPARILRLVEEGAEFLVVGRRVASRGGGVVGRVLEEGHELQDAEGLAEDVQGALAQLEALGADGELGREARVEGVDGREVGVEGGGDLLAGVPLGLGQGLLGQGDELAELLLGCLLGVGVRGKVGVVEAAEGDAERGGVGGQLGSLGVERGVEVGRCETALHHAQVVVDGARDELIGGDEALRDEEAQLRARLGEGHGAGGQGRAEGDEKGGAPLREDGGGLVHATTVDADGALRHNGQLGQLGLVDGFLAVGDHDGQCRGAGEGSRGGQAATGGDGAVHEDLHRDGLVVGTVLLAQELECATQAGLEVVGPFVHRGVNLDGVRGNVELAGGEFGGLDVGDLNLESARLHVGGVDFGGDGDDGIGGNGHGQDGVERVVNVLANNVDSAWGAGDKVGGLAICRLELGQEIVPPFALGGEGICCVDLVQRPRERDWAGHDQECSMEMVLKEGNGDGDGDGGGGGGGGGGRRQICIP